MEASPILLLTTKLYRPAVGDHWVPRPALLARLDRGLAHKLILLSAPPGFGKSSLVSHWVDHLAAKAPLPPFPKPVPNSCWLTLDEGDNQLLQFLHYLVAAIRTCAPAACPTTHSLLSAAHLPSVDYLVTVVVSELSALAGELVLVLDNYHLIHAEAVQQVMRQLLRYLPSGLHLVILTRSDPPLHLGRLRLAQEITELRAGDLRFTAAETEHFFKRQLNRALNDETLTLLHERAEGWITALQLASIALQHQDPDTFLEEFRGSNRLLVRYLVEEVLAQLPEPMRQFLLRTALVSRFCAPLADTLLADCLPQGGSQALLAQAEAQNLFVIALDQTGEWMRYHDLFRDFLRYQLQRSESPETLVRLHRLASAWFGERGLIEEALHHALAAGDHTVATELLMNQLHPMLERQLPGPTLTRWLAFFPPALIETQPQLLLAQLWLSAFGIGPAMPLTQLAHIETMIRTEPALGTDERQLLLADLAMLRGIIAYWGGDPQRALALLQLALDQQPPTRQFVRAQILIHLAAAHTSIGETAVGRALLHTALAVEKTQRRPTLMLLLGGLAILHLHAGELADVIDIASQAVTAVDEIDGPTAWQGIGFVETWYAWAHYLLGMATYEQNDLATAAYHWQRVAAMRYRTNPSVYQGSLLGLALIAQASHALDEARAYAEDARAFVMEIRRPNLLAIAASFEVRLALLNGQTADAERRTQEIEAAASQGVAVGVELPPLTRIQALLAVATPAALTAALAFTTTCLYHAEQLHNTLQLAQLYARQALILHALGRTEEGLQVLAQALHLGEQCGLVRTFLDLGKPLAALLRHYEPAHSRSTYVRELLATFSTPADANDRNTLATYYAKAHGITPLTVREIELLRLIRQRLSLNEIAAVLSISVNTVKKHTNNIYTKLGVRNRREAVATAERLGVLPPS